LLLFDTLFSFFWPGLGLGSVEFSTSCAAFMKSGAKSHLLWALSVSRSKNNSVNRPKSCMWVFCQ
jgi:hypothetical protein